MGNYTIEPVQPLDYNPSFYQPMRETVTDTPSGPGQLMLMIHWKPFQFATHGNLLGGKTALKESTISKLPKMTDSCNFSL